MTYQRLAMPRCSNDVPAYCPSPKISRTPIGQHLIDGEEERRGDEYHQKHHPGRDQRLLAGRPGDPRQLLAHLLDEFGR